MSEPLPLSSGLDRSWFFRPRTFLAGLVAGLALCSVVAQEGVPPRLPRGLHALSPGHLAGGAVLSDPGRDVRHRPHPLPARPGPGHCRGQLGLQRGGAARREDVDRGASAPPRRPVRRVQSRLPRRALHGRRRHGRRGASQGVPAPGVRGQRPSIQPAGCRMATILTATSSGRRSTREARGLRPAKTSAWRGVGAPSTRWGERFELWSRDWLDRALRFRDLWNWVGYEYLFTIPTPITPHLPQAIWARKRFADNGARLRGRCPSRKFRPENREAEMNIVRGFSYSYYFKDRRGSGGSSPRSAMGSRRRRRLRSPTT